MAWGPAHDFGFDHEALLAAFNLNTDGTMICGPDGQVIYANPALCEVFGSTAKEIRSRNQRELIGPSGGRDQGMARAFRPDGSFFLAEVSSIPLPGDGGSGLHLLGVRDVTRAVRTERRLKGIAEVSNALLAGTDPDRVMTEVVAYARFLMDGAGSVLIAMGEGSGGVAGTVVGGGYMDELVRHSRSDPGVASLIGPAWHGSILRYLSPRWAVDSGGGPADGSAILVRMGAAGRLFGLIAVASMEQRFRPEDMSELRSFVDATAWALAVAGDRDASQHRDRRTVRQLQQALDSRVLIEQAKGFIAGGRGIGPEDAFDVLRRYARSHNADIHDVASAVVERRLVL